MSARSTGLAGGALPATGPSWPWWAAPAAVLLALTLTLLGSALVTGIVSAAGVEGVLTGDNGAVNVGLTVVQDLAFIVGPLVLAGILAESRRVRLAPFGLVRVAPRLALKWMGIAIALYLALSALFAQVAGGQEQKDLFEQLNVRAGSAAVLPVAFVVCVLAPLAEEFLFRGFCYPALRGALRPAGAALAVGGIFGLVHFASTPPVQLVQLGLLGALLCVVREATGSLLPCVGVHAANNAIAFGALVGWGAGTLGLLAGSLGACALILAPLTSPRAPR